MVALTGREIGFVRNKINTCFFKVSYYGAFNWSYAIGSWQISFIPLLECAILCFIYISLCLMTILLLDVNSWRRTCNVRLTNFSGKWDSSCRNFFLLRISYKLKVYAPTKFIGWQLIPSIMVFGGSTFRKRSGYEDGVPFPMWDYNAETTVYEIGRRFPPDTKYAGILL